METFKTSKQGDLFTFFHEHFGNSFYANDSYTSGFVTMTKVRTELQFLRRNSSISILRFSSDRRHDTDKVLLFDDVHIGEEHPIHSHTVVKS